MEYQDFTIDIRSKGRGRFEATVVESLLGESPQVIFRRPFERKALLRLLEGVDKRVRDDLRGDTEGRRKRPLAELSARQIGQQLYSALFEGKVANLFERCRAALPPDGRSGLRLRFKFLLNDMEAEYLGALPWEWLWAPRTGAFVATERSTPIVRDFAIPSRRPLEMSLPLRILVVDAAPETMHKLNLRLEFERMKEALGPLATAGKVELREVGKPTPEALRVE